MRRLLLALAVVGLSLATLARPAAGQSTPPRPVVITSVKPSCAPLRQPVRIAVSGTSEPGARGGITVSAPSGQLVTEASWGDGDGNGTWSATLTEFTPAENGYYRVEATDGFGNISRARFSAPCRNPQVVLDPDCFRPGQATRLIVRAFDFAPFDRGYVTYDSTTRSGGTDGRGRIGTDGAGNFDTSGSQEPQIDNSPFDVTPADRADIPLHVWDLQDNAVTVRWLKCPPPGVTTTSTTAPPPDDPPATTSTTEAPIVTVPPTVTVTFPDRPGSTTTSTTSTTIPPVTPGATLVVTPALGPPGFVTIARGTGFPAGVVDLTWAPGLGGVSPVVAADGTFSVQVLVFPKDRIGPRTLVATGSSTTATANFLVVPSSVQPSGSDVSQITRSRRFNQR